MRDVQFEADHEEVPVEEWLKKLIKRNVWRRQLQNRMRGNCPHIAELILENMKDAFPEELAKHPRDGASEHDHYIYGTPKRNS
ncbi:MAG TPA: hypothetical protein VLU25_05415 [Acidobacteriota bacterium]|nr:hypothetical protein [Acidobacteriota bacterium]